MLEHHYVQEKLMEYRHAQQHRRITGVPVTADLMHHPRSMNPKRRTFWTLLLTSGLFSRKKGKHPLS